MGGLWSDTLAIHPLLHTPASLIKRSNKASLSQSTTNRPSVITTVASLWPENKYNLLMKQCDLSQAPDINCRRVDINKQRVLGVD